MQIQLPVSSLNTLKPTISLPSLSDDDDDSSTGGGINLPSFEMSSSSGFGGAGWGGAGWSSSTGFGGAGGGNDAFGSSSSPFDTINGNYSSSSSNANANGGGFGNGDFSDGLTTPSASATIRSNPFNNNSSTSWDQGAVDGFGESPFEEGEETEQDGQDQQDTLGKNRGFGFGGSTAAARGSANGFSFGGVTKQSLTNKAKEEEEEERETTPTESTFNLPIPSSISSPSLPSSSTFGSTSTATSTSTTTNLEPPSLLNRRRADTAPSSRPPPNASSFVQDSTPSNGGYPPLGAGLPRTSSHPGGGGVGAGLARSTSTPNSTDQEQDGDPSPLPTLNEDSTANRPFGSGFKFGGVPQSQSQSQGRERAATMLSSTSAPGDNIANRPFRFGGVNSGVAVEGNSLGERKRSGSDGRRQGLKVPLSLSLCPLSMTDYKARSH